VATGQMIRSSVIATMLVLTKRAFSWKTTRREDVFGGAPQEGSAASFGPLGINFKAHKPADDQGRL
jgi:hypothetical protein